MDEVRPHGDKRLTRAIPVPDAASQGPVVLPELQLFEQPVFRDTRGAFAELWREQDEPYGGLPRFVQDNVARSRRGVVRGLHFQNPHFQAKLVSIALGEVFDVAVDVRVGSPTFGRWSAYRLSEANGRQLYIPPGFAHAYQTTSDVSVVIYKCSDFYSPEAERTVRWDDPQIGIEWPIPNAMVSARDAAAPLLRDILTDWLPHIDR
ncbi:MAG TPA: dTDP-4-dehydrorhamnose 3,5-epimerase [Gemmatimonadaceae bacterium]|nr:dTDP-4-dehydrorhamnose 3,5-epimerase [Gemmatimonadaceae bacterium]